MNIIPSLEINSFKNKANLKTQLNLTELNDQQAEMLFGAGLGLKRAVLSMMGIII